MVILLVFWPVGLPARGGTAWRPAFPFSWPFLNMVTGFLTGVSFPFFFPRMTIGLFRFSALAPRTGLSVLPL